jgi:hypothetical protein
VTSFPIDRIRQAIHPAGEQVTFLDDLATASSKASAVLNASCPNQPPLTPLARLDAVERRLEATIRAIESVRTALATLYDSLNDEQRQRLDAIGAEDIGRGRGTAANGSSGTNLASLCSDQATNFTRLPVQRIEEVVKPTGQQQSALEKLKQTSENAADALRASCPSGYFGSTMFPSRTRPAWVTFAGDGSPIVRPGEARTQLIPDLNNARIFPLPRRPRPALEFSD